MSENLEGVSFLASAACFCSSVFGTDGIPSRYEALNQISKKNPTSKNISHFCQAVFGTNLTSQRFGLFGLGVGFASISCLYSNSTKGPTVSNLRSQLGTYNKEKVDFNKEIKRLNLAIGSRDKLLREQRETLDRIESLILQCIVFLANPEAKPLLLESCDKLFKGGFTPYESTSKEVKEQNIKLRNELTDAKEDKRSCQLTLKSHQQQPKEASIEQIMYNIDNLGIRINLLNETMAHQIEDCKRHLVACKIENQPPELEEVKAIKQEVNTNDKNIPKQDN